MAKMLMELITEVVGEEDLVMNVANEECHLIRWDVDEVALILHFWELFQDRIQTWMTLLKDLLTKITKEVI